MSQCVIVLCTVPDKNTGQTLARSLLEQKLCACVNIIPAIDSIYLWQGKIEESTESMLFIKTTKDCYKLVEQHIKSLHSYDNPEIIMLEIRDGASDYLTWITNSIDK